MALHRCASCDGWLVEITFSLEGAPVTMRSCSACDRRSWHREGEQVDLAGALGADVRRR